MPEARPVCVTVDGRRRTGLAEPRLLLCDFLRHELGLTSVHVACEQGGCGACTIRLDGRLTLSCLVLAVQANGSVVDTAAGLARDGELHPIQQAFRAMHGLQCGFCTPGMLLATRALLESDPRPTSTRSGEHLSGNVCRCTGYSGIVAAVREAARLMSRGGPMSRPFRHVGRSLPRFEDERLLRGRVGYLDDVRLPGMLHVAFVRSPFAHARIEAVDATEARALDGVAAVSREPISPDELEIVTGSSRPEAGEWRRPLLPRDRVRHVGEPVAAVVARSRYLAEDACELVAVDYEPLEPVTDAERALEPDAPRLHEEQESNNFAHIEFRHGDVDAAFADAAHVFRKRFHFGRTARGTARGHAAASPTGRTP